jgi:hypothetical protein
VSGATSLKIGVLVGGGRIKKWQAEALRAVAGSNLFFIYDCANSRSRRRPFKHGLYYGLNLLAVRNPMTTRVPVPGELRVEHRIEFEAEADGAWERLPQRLLDRIAEDAPDLIVKFGMGLLHVPEQLGCPILSYHHGDPRHFRGRPAGFHELMSGTTEVGQVVQILSDELDAGAVVAFAETKAHPHSWRQSLIEAYRVSPLLLGPAIRNVLAGETLPIEPNGKNYRLPSNATALHFMARVAAAKARRLAYGAFVEKAWQVAEAELPDGWSMDDLGSITGLQGWRILPGPKPYRFLADPFYGPNGKILAEAMRPNGRGEIASFEDGKFEALPIRGGHCSYPSTVEFEGRHFLLPETSDWSPPRLFEFTASGLEDRGELDLPDRPHLFDPTLFAHQAGWFLFGNRAGEGDRVLRLWGADSPLGPFAEHPESPIRISPAGSRMAGAILERGGQLYRPGQDLRRGYGDGLLLFHIAELSRTAYRETQCLELRFRERGGPHTLNIRGNRALFDFYDNRFSLLAGVRRLRQSRAG